MAFGTNIPMPADRIQGRPDMRDAGDGLTAVTLSAREVRTNGVHIFGLMNVAVLTAKVLIKLNPLVGICQSSANSHPGGGW